MSQYCRRAFLTMATIALLSPAGLGAQPAPSIPPLQLTYLGAAGWEIRDGSVTVLVDPYISRLKYGGGGHPDDGRPAFARTDVAWSDTVLIDRIITDADFILVHHGHFDHLGDVPYIARKTGARVIGTETTMTILRAYGVPDEQLYAVRGGEDYQFDRFSVRVVPGLHSALGEKHYHDSRRWDAESGLEAPLRIDQFIEGGSLSFLARFEGRTVLTMGSMNFIEREFEGLDPDVLLAGINGSRLGLYNYDERLLRVTDYPPVVIPTHWDNFRLPYGFSQRANYERNIAPFIDVAAKVSPETRVISPTHLEPILLHDADVGAVEGSRRFDRQLALEDEAVTSANVSIGDVNADGHQDIFLVKGRHWPLEDLILLGDGGGSFEPAYPVGSTADRSYSGVLVDMDRDGDLDIVVSNDEPDPKLVHLNDGHGRFEVGSTFGRPDWSTRHVEVADLNGDALPDVVLANRSGGESGWSYICFGVEGGRFAEECVGFALGSSTTITAADFNDDGALDLVVPHRDGGQSFVYLNDGRGNFEDRRPFGPPDAAIRSAVAADLDEDGTLDLVVIDERTGPAILRGRADGTFAAADRPGPGRPAGRHRGVCRIAAGRLLQRWPPGSDAGAFRR